MLARRPTVSTRRGMRSAVTRLAATAARRFDSHSRGRIMRGLSSCGGRVNKYCITTRRDTCRDCAPVHSAGPGGPKSLSGHKKPGLLTGEGRLPYSSAVVPRPIHVN